MKKYIIGFLICLCIVICYGASFDSRQFPQTPVFRVEVPQLSRDDGDANNVSDTVNINGIIRQVTVGINDNAGDATATVSIVDDNNSVLFTTATIAENTEDAPTAQHYALDPNLPLAIPVTGLVTIDANLSGNPGSTGMTIDVVLYGD